MLSEAQFVESLKRERPPNVLLSVDGDACELRTWAQCNYELFGFSDLGEILNNPKRCPHIEFGTLIKGKQNDQAADWADRFAYGYALKKAKDPDSRSAIKKLRNLAKGPNFGLPGGMGAERLMDYCRVGYGTILTLAEAKSICALWRSMYREAQMYLDWVKSQVGKQRGSRTAIEQFYSKRLRGNVGFCDGANGFFQGLAADAFKAVGWALAKEAYCATNSPFYGARSVDFIHDEHVYCVSRDRCHEAGYRMRDITVEVWQRYCPDVLVTASPAAMYRLSKPAGDPYHIKDGKLADDGELIPFEERLLYA